ncbi:MAG: DNA repair protein RadA [Patescibacteria group bacterium]
MAAKLKIIFRCTKCDAQYPKWQGRCVECGSWGTVVEDVAPQPRRTAGAGGTAAGTVETLADVSLGREARLPSGIGEFDRVLGGGIIGGSVSLVGGDPGIGKSTLILQVAGRLASAGRPVLYVSGEESAAQVKVRFERLRLTTPHLKFLGATDLDTIVATIAQLHPELVIIDSIQTIQCADVDGVPGSVGQVRAATSQLTELAKQSRVPIILIGHVTKQGSVAGPRTLEHLVDVVLYLEGDQHHLFRVLRSVKNRFGATTEVGVFDMQRDGLHEVLNPSAVFLAERRQASPGSAVTAVVEGSRAFLVEVQSLVTRTNFGYPQRRAAGFDFNRLQLLIAVLVKKAGLYLGNQDIHLNVAGGFRVGEPAVDVAVCLAIASATKGKPVSAGTAVFGEVGLAGELRAVAQTEKRLEEIKKMGFQHVLLPRTKLSQPPTGLHLMYGETIGEAIRDLV